MTTPEALVRTSSLVVGALLLLSNHALAASPGQIGPDFACPRPPPVDGLAQAICDNPAMSREEMVFEQAYYALRHALGRDSWKSLKAEAVTFNTDLRATCGIPQAGAPDQTQPSGAADCYIRETERDRNAWLSRLSGASRQEAARPIEQHIALQQQLVDLGYLPAGTPADGIYGEASRVAISRWQTSTQRPTQDGFISGGDANALMRSSAAVEAGSAASAGGGLLQTSSTVFACANPRATRAINNTADPRQQNAGWVAFVKSDGRCFEASPDQQWEQISTQGDLLLLRRTPPVVGEPPLFFRASDIRQVVAQPAPAVVEPAPVTVDEQPAPQPQAAPQIAAAPVPAPAPAPVETPPAPAPVEEPSAPPGSPSGSGGGFSALVVILLTLGAIGWFFYARNQAALRRRGKALEIALAEVTAQQRALRVRKLQLVTADAYGTVDVTKWVREKEHFLKTRVLPLLASAGLSEEWPLIAREVDHQIEIAASTVPTGAQQAYVSDPHFFDPRMTPTDYELHCALLLRSTGWDAQTTVASGDQGTDVIARRNGLVLVVQCKLYSQPVGNSAVQEISAARMHYQADYAAVVSNASFTTAARQLARTNGVFLLHHEELLVFDPAAAVS
jgi:restriction system protein